MKQRTEKILEYFFKICKIPRPSGHEKQIQTYLREWAESRNYKVKSDITGNLIITFLIIMLFSLCRFSYKLFYQFINKKSKQSANRI